MFDNIDVFERNFVWIEQLKEVDFETAALTIFRFQAAQNPVYKAYLEAIGIDSFSVSNWQQIPFLPIGFFKTHRVLCDGLEAPDYFESSGTTATSNSRHYLADKNLYRACFLHHFQQFYGSPGDYIFFCLLPSYLERKHASLVYMAEELIRQSGREESAFYLNDFDELAEGLKQVVQQGKKAILLGVTFALLDFAEKYPMDLSSVIVMETGGMKGRREEWTRFQIHDFLKKKWQINAVHSEYGMTELFSQAYSKGKGIYQTPNLMRVSVREQNDPFSNFHTGSGCLNIIDLGNLHSCSFIATDDIGKVYENGSFEVMGRIDYAALRGCSLMVV